MTQEPHVGTTEAELIKARRAKLDALRVCGHDPFSHTTFARSDRIVAVRQAHEGLHNGQHSSDSISIAGRLQALRRMGKRNVFSDLVDQSGRLQLYFRADDLGDLFELVNHLDRGDIIGASGKPFKTKTGELTLAVEKLSVLAKSLRPLPEKWHGLSDTELRYRQRYVDLIVNRQVLDTMLLRSRIIASLRRYLDERGYVEVETPTLLTIAGGASARPFLTRSNALDIPLQLRIATELNLKRCIVGGIEKVYELGRIFRNEGIDARHNPEFTMLELYEAYTDYEGMMRLCEDILVYLAHVAGAVGRHGAGGDIIDFRRPFKRMTFIDAIAQWSELGREDILDESLARAAANKLGIETSADEGHAHVIDKIFEAVAEPHLADPTFIVDFPVVLSPFAKRKKDDPQIVERFELFVDHMEAANAFSELNDPDEQRARFLSQARERAQGDAETPEPDWDFIRALQYGMPPTGGIGIGVDRLVMLLCGEQSVRDVLLFPLQKPL